MRIADVMTPNVRFIRPDTTIREVAAAMFESNIGALPVCTGERLVGMVSDRDITIRATALGKSLDTPASEVMSPGILWCFEDQGLDEALRLMEEEQVRRLPVMSRQRRLVGIVTVADLAARLTASRLGELVKELSEPTTPRP